MMEKLKICVAYANSADLRIMELETELAAEKDRSAAWANTAKAIAILCHFRYSGFCTSICAGRKVCDCEGLHLLTAAEVPMRWREVMEKGS